MAETLDTLLDLVGDQAGAALTGPLRLKGQIEDSYYQQGGSNVLIPGLLTVGGPEDEEKKVKDPRRLTKALRTVAKLGNTGNVTSLGASSVIDNAFERAQSTTHDITTHEQLPLSVHMPRQGQLAAPHHTASESFNTFDFSASNYDQPTTEVNNAAKISSILDALEGSDQRRFVEPGFDHNLDDRVRRLQDSGGSYTETVRTEAAPKARLLAKNLREGPRTLYAKGNTLYSVNPDGRHQAISTSARPTETWVDGYERLEKMSGLFGPDKPTTFDPNKPPSGISLVDLTGLVYTLREVWDAHKKREAWERQKEIHDALLMAGKVAEEQKLRKRTELYIYRYGKDGALEVLVGKAPYTDGAYTFPGGGVDSGESVNAAGKREALEEVGAKVKAPKSLLRPSTEEWTEEEKKEEKKKGRDFEGTQTYYRFAEYDKKDTSLYDSEGDALKARFVPLGKVVENLTKALDNTKVPEGSEAYGAYGPKHAPRHLKALAKLQEKLEQKKAAHTLLSKFNLAPTNNLEDLLYDISSDGEDCVKLAVGLAALDTLRRVIPKRLQRPYARAANWFLNPTTQLKFHDIGKGLVDDAAGVADFTGGLQSMAGTASSLVSNPANLHAGDFANLTYSLPWKTLEAGSEAMYRGSGKYVDDLLKEIETADVKIPGLPQKRLNPPKFENPFLALNRSPTRKAASLELPKAASLELPKAASLELPKAASENSHREMEMRRWLNDVSSEAKKRGYDGLTVAVDDNKTGPGGGSASYGNQEGAARAAKDEAHKWQRMKGLDPENGRVVASKEAAKTAQKLLEEFHKTEPLYTVNTLLNKLAEGPDFTSASDRAVSVIQGAQGNQETSADNRGPLPTTVRSQGREDVDQILREFDSSESPLDHIVTNYAY